MLAPHDRIQGEFEVVRGTPQDLADRLEFVIGQAEGPVQGLLGGGVVGRLVRGTHDDFHDRGRTPLSWQFRGVAPGYRLAEDGRVAHTTTRSRSAQVTVASIPDWANQASCSAVVEGMS